jgi:hypothetical protein
MMEAAMAAWITFATVGVTGTIFYLRFLLALRGEWKRVSVCYLAHIEPAPREIVVIQPAHKKRHFLRAA